MSTNINGELVIKKSVLALLIVIITLLTSFTSVIVQAATMQTTMDNMEVRINDMKEDVEIIDTQIDTCEQNMIKCGMDIEHIKGTLDRIETKIDKLNE